MSHFVIVCGSLHIYKIGNESEVSTPKNDFFFGFLKLK